MSVSRLADDCLTTIAIRVCDIVYGDVSPPLWKVMKEAMRHKQIDIQLGMFERAVIDADRKRRFEDGEAANE